MQGKALWQQLWPRLVPYRLKLLWGIIALLISSGLGLMFPHFFGQAIDAAFRNENLATLDRSTLILVAIFAGQATFIYFRHTCFSWLGERVVANLRIQLHKRLLGLDQAYFSQHQSGALMSRLQADVGHLQSVVGQDLSIALRNGLTLVGGICILLWIHLTLTTVMLAVVPPLILLTVFWGKRLKKLGKQVQDELAGTAGKAQEHVADVATVQVFGQNAYLSTNYARSIEGIMGLLLRMIRARSLLMSLASFIAFSCIAGIFWLGGKMVMRGEMTPGELSEFFLYTTAVAGAVAAIAGLMGRLQQAAGASSRIFEILAERPTIDAHAEGRQLAQCRGEYELTGVYFDYPNGTRALQGLDLRLAPGQITAVVGSSGSGKTTLVKLLMRLWDPSAGTIQLDGVPLTELDLAWYRQQLAVVSQDVVLFTGTIAENIAFGRPDASRDEIEKAARAAYADEFIRAFDEGYATRVGERGLTLSGGQRQRIAIARAILVQPSVLIFDEATSALDSESEYWVQKALFQLCAGRTALIVAHRLSTIRRAHQIAVVEDGRVVETGSHDELVAQGALYRRLVARQNGLRDKAENVRDRS